MRSRFFILEYDRLPRRLRQAGSGNVLGRKTVKIDHHAPSHVTDGISGKHGFGAAYETLLRELGEPGLSALQVAAIVALVFVLPMIAGLWR